MNKDDATAGELAAIKRADEADELAAKLQEENATLREDLAAAQAKFQNQLRRAQQKAVAKPRSKKARKIGEAANDRDVLDAAMTDDNPLELVFSSGTREIVELDPLEIHPAGFRKVHGGIYQVSEAILVRGTGEGIRVRGVGLVDHDGVQIGYCAFADPVDVAIGTEVKFDRMISF